MQLFTFDKHSYNVRISEEVLLLKPFKAIFDADKSKSKDQALNEFAFIWFYTDIKSPYQAIIDPKIREEEILKSIDLPKSWKRNKVIDAAIEFYRERSKSIVHQLYDAAMIAADSVNDVFTNSKDLIASSDDKITAAQKVVQALEKVPKVMQSLRDIEKELLKEIDDKEGKKKGSREFALYEDGLEIE